MFKYRCIHRIAFCVLAAGLTMNANAMTIDFQGNLDVIEDDSGGAIYSGVPIGTVFTGTITDLQSDGSFASGLISGGGTATSFNCVQPIGTTINDDGEIEPQCGGGSDAGPGVSNNVVIDDEGAALLNSILGPMTFSPGDEIDSINIEGDADTSSGGRIEAGLTYIFPAETFASGLSTFEEVFPFFNPDDATVALFFILEENATRDEDIYRVLGQLDAAPTPEVPLPAAAWLFGSALFGLVAIRKRS